MTMTVKTQADAVYDFLTEALKSGTSPEVIQSEFEAALRFAVQMKQQGLWPDAVSVGELKDATQAWWQS